MVACDTTICRAGADASQRCRPTIAPPSTMKWSSGSRSQRPGRACDMGPGHITAPRGVSLSRRAEVLAQVAHQVEMNEALAEPPGARHALEAVVVAAGEDR